MELREKQKKEAVKRMRKLGMIAGVIKDFEKEDRLQQSENGGMLYWIDDETKEAVKKFEEQYGGLVYHLIKSFTEIGIMYAMLYVSAHEEEWEYDMEDIEGRSVVAYVYNADHPELSELGGVSIRPSFGGLVRTA